MIHLRNAAVAAIAFACLSSAVSAAPLDAPRARIVYADLDLASVAGRVTLDHRIAGAVRTVCVADTRDLAAQSAAARCRADAARDAHAQIAARRDTQVAAR